VALTGRRQVLQAGIGGVAGMSCGLAGLPLSLATAQPSVGTERLDSTLHLLTVGPTNMIARTGPDSVVLVDGVSTEFAGTALAQVAELSGGIPVGTIFNTHWHPEHTGLNERLGRDGAAIIAQENTRLWLSTDITWPWDGQHFEPLTAIAQPNETFYDEGELDDDVAYGYLRHCAHTDGDLYVHFRDANALAVGDAVSGAGWPLVDWWTGGWIGGIVGTMELVLALADDATRIVPARGRILNRGEIEEQYEMYNVLYERLARLLNSGRGPDEAVAARPAEEYEARMGPSDVFVRRAFESLWAYLSPDA